MSETPSTTTSETEKPITTETEDPSRFDWERKVFKLSKPLVMGERTITELSLDCSGLSTNDFTSLADECRMRYRITSDADSIMSDVKFRFLVLANGFSNNSAR